MVVENDPKQRESVLSLLRSLGHNVTAPSSFQEILAMGDQLEIFDVAFIDYDLWDTSNDGYSVGRLVRFRNDRAALVMITGVRPLAWQAMESLTKHNFSYHVDKPINKTKVTDILDHPAVKTAAWRRSLLSQPAMIGSSKEFIAMMKEIECVAESNATVLLSGESGTGKELAANHIHNSSKRKGGKFFGVNCGALAETLLESELFGHVKGAFTDARTDKVGLFKRIDGGTLLLDEITETTNAFQVKLLRVLQERKVIPVGGDIEEKVDVRIIASTNRNISEEVANGKFRGDLYYRICEYPIIIPPLRERTEDIPSLMDCFLKIYASEHKKSDVPFVSRDAMDYLMRHNWPGNVRELQNVASHAILMLRGRKSIELDDVRKIIPEGSNASKSISHIGDSRYEVKIIEQQSSNYSLAKSLIHFLNNGGHLYRLTDDSQKALRELYSTDSGRLPMHRKSLRKEVLGFELKVEYAAYDPDGGSWKYNGKIERVAISAPTFLQRKSRLTGDEGVVASRDWGVLTNKSIWGKVASEIRYSLRSTPSVGSVQLNCLPEAIAIYFSRRRRKKYHEIVAMLFDPICLEHSENLQRQILPGRSIVNRLRRDVSQGVSDDPTVAEGELLRIYELLDYSE